MDDRIRVRVQSLPQETWVIISAGDALVAAWQVWLVKVLGESAQHDPPQSFEIQDGSWCQWLRPYHVEPFCLRIPASEQHAATLAAFRHLEGALGLTPYRTEQGPL